MILPNNGKVIIIDDDPADVKSLATALTREKMPFLFFKDLDMDDLPESPVNNVRLLFLDLDLGLGGYTAIEKIRLVQQRIIRIIEENTPYILVLWSSHEDQYAQTLIDEFENGFKNYKPIGICSLDKNEIKQLEKSSSNGSVISLLRTRFSEQLSQFNSFNIFLLWESIINDTCGDAVNDLILALDKSGDWNKTLKTIVKKLAHAYLGSRMGNVGNEIIQRSAMLTFNELFKENLEKTILKSAIINGIDYNDVFASNKNTIAKLNSKLLFEPNTESERSPGSVYLLSNEEKEHLSIEIKKKTGITWAENIIDRKELTSVYLEENNTLPENERLSKNKIGQNVSAKMVSIIQNSLPIEIEISPICDFAQKKRILSRCIKGCLLSMDDVISKSIKTKTDYLYISPLLYYNGNLYKIILDYRLFSSCLIKEIEDTIPIFKLRHQLLVDIQINAARHVSRTGVTFIDERDFSFSA